jgi:hypothetical protein
MKSNFLSLSFLIEAVEDHFCREYFMSLSFAYPHIIKEEGQPARLERIPRVRVAQIVMDYLAYGWSVEEMCRQHPYLTLAEAHTAMAYYFDHQNEIDTEIATELNDVDESRRRAIPTALEVRLKARGIL